jgi:hypothetical protein
MERAVIVVRGDFDSGFWWRLVSSSSGHIIKESSVYDARRFEDPRQLAYDDAHYFARMNGIDVIRYG